MMKQKKRVWMSFNLWEANVFEQYLEEMAAQGWFLESVGGSVMKFHRAEPAKRRYAALLVPGSSSLTGADSWKAELFRKQCQEAGWNFPYARLYFLGFAYPVAPVIFYKIRIAVAPCFRSGIFGVVQ